MRGGVQRDTIDADKIVRRWRGMVDGQPLLCIDEIELISDLRSDQATLAVSGDPIICRALVLLLRGPAYEVKYLPVASLDAPGTLAGVQVLLLALERDAAHRGALLRGLREATDTDKVHILELADARGGRPEWPRWSRPSGRRIPWPCSTDELRQRIESTLSNSPPVVGGSY